MLSAGNIGFSAVGKEGDQVLFSYACVLTCIQVSVRVHVKGLRGIRVLHTYLMDINIKETIINTLTTLQPASPLFVSSNLQHELRLLEMLSEGCHHLTTSLANTIQICWWFKDKKIYGMYMSLFFFFAIYKKAKMFTWALIHERSKNTKGTNNRNASEHTDESTAILSGSSMTCTTLLVFLTMHMHCCGRDINLAADVITHIRDLAKTEL